MKKNILLLVSIFVFACGNLMLYLHILHLDNQYSLLIKTSTNRLKLLHRLTNESTRGYILLFKAIHSENLDSAIKYAEEREIITKRNNQLLDSLTLETPSGSSLEAINKLVSVRKLYVGKSTEIVSLVRSNNQDLAIKSFEQDLEYFQDYQQQINSLFGLEKEILDDNNYNFSSEVKSRAHILLAFTYSPLILFILVFSVSLAAYYIISTIFLKSPNEV